MTTRLIDIRGPNAEEAEGGAWIVFHRRDRDGVTEYFIKASYYEGSYQQWGAPTPILGDNVEAVTQWAAGLREVEDFVRDDEDDEDEDDDLDEAVHEAAQARRLDRLNATDDPDEQEAIIAEGEAEASEINNAGADAQRAYLDQ